MRDFAEGKSIVMVTKKGIVKKKRNWQAFSNPSHGWVIAMSVDEGDDLIDVQLTLGNQELFMGTARAWPSGLRKRMCGIWGRAAGG